MIHSKHRISNRARHCDQGYGKCVQSNSCLDPPGVGFKSSFTSRQPCIINGFITARAISTPFPVSVLENPRWVHNGGQTLQNQLINWKLEAFYKIRSLLQVTYSYLANLRHWPWAMKVSPIYSVSAIRTLSTKIDGRISKQFAIHHMNQQWSGFCINTGISYPEVSSVLPSNPTTATYFHNSIFTANLAWKR